jgi:hypothetical protein
MKILVLLLACSALPLSGQHIHQDQKGVQTHFVIDPTKPYVYLEVDHVGPRDPRRKGEPTVGLWLRLKNNATLPIIVSTFGAPPGSPECGVMDDVVRNPRMEGVATITSMADLSAPSRPTRGEEEPPPGYMSDVRTATSVPPGGQISFSVPIDHVGPNWHFEVPFRFDLQRRKSGREPISFVTFYQEDLPPRKPTVASPTK